MSTPQTSMTQKQRTTPPSSFAKHPLTPPPTDQKRFAQVERVLALFREIQAGKHIKRAPWTEFQLREGDYDEIKCQLRQDDELLGFAKDKIRYDYSGKTHRLVVRMPTATHELFIASVEDAILSQLKSIREGSGNAAAFARKVRPARSAAIYFPVDGDPFSRKSKHEPDASFWHTSARYPGVIIEVSYSQKPKNVNRLAEDYLLDSNASVQVVIGLDIEYGKKESRKATMSLWRTQLVGPPDARELTVTQELENMPFRDDQGNATGHPGLSLRLGDFAYEELTRKEIPDDNRRLVISAGKLCEYLDAAENMMAQPDLLGEHTLAANIKKRKRPETPPEELGSADEARYAQSEVRAAKRMAEGDSDYHDTSSVKSSSD